MSLNQEDYQSLENILCNEEALKKLKYQGLKIPELEAKGKKWEKRIQDIFTNYFEHNLKISIIEESFDNLPELQKHSYILIDQLKNALLKCNEQLFKNYSHFSKNELLELLLNDFLERFKNSSNVDRHKLYFEINSKLITLKDKNNNQKQEYYNVLDLNTYSNNKITIIKEKKIVDEHILKESELPDFAYYINGLPFIAIEIKTPETGIYAAIKDYNNKYSYKQFLLCLGTDGNKVFLSSNHSSLDIFLWQNYGKKETKGGIKDICKELLFNINNFMFYCQFCIMPLYKNNTITLRNARIQQYIVAKEYYSNFSKLLAKRNEKKPIMFKNYFKHHTRSGKSFTFNIILNILGKGYTHQGKLDKLYNKIYIITHDLVVKDNLRKEFGNYYFGDFANVIEINNKQQYKDSIKNNKKGIYLLNIQKTELEKEDISSFLTTLTDDNKEIKQIKINDKDVYQKDDVLFLIDEIHTHQNLKGGFAYVRNKLFPNASYITTTATPIVDEKLKLDITSEYFGERIDDFKASDAIRLEIVVPLMYQKYLWTIKNNDTASIKNIKTQIQTMDDFLKQITTNSIIGGNIDKVGFFKDYDSSYIEKNIITKLLENLTIQKLFKKPTKENLIEILIENYKIETIDRKIITKVDDKIITIYGKENIDVLIQEFETLKKEEVLKLYKQTKEEIMYGFSRDLIPYKLNLITQDVSFLKTETKDFNPKFFWVVEDIKTGLAILTYIKEQTKDNQNVYNNVRFALDVSSIDLNNIDSDDKKYLSENEIKLKDINGNYVVGDKPITDFESDKQGAIDILIIVGKYLMGYDLDKLLKVYLDTKIKVLF